MEAYLEDHARSLRRQEKEQAALNKTLRARHGALPSSGRRLFLTGPTSAGRPGGRQRFGRPRVLDKVVKPDDFIHHRPGIEKMRSVSRKDMFDLVLF